MKLRNSTNAERLYFYANSHQISMQTGLIGYLRGDFVATGGLFFSNFFDIRHKMKTERWVPEFDNVINALRVDPQFYGILAGRPQMAAFCTKTATEQNTLSDYPHYGYRVDTEGYVYLIRYFPLKGDYNFYVYCYNKQMLDTHIRNAKKGIRFIDSHYNEKFRVEDGAKVRLITTSRGSKDWMENPSIIAQTQKT